MTDKEEPYKENKELRLLFQLLQDDIKFAKRRQWAVTYYCLVTFAAIVGFYKITAHPAGSICWSQDFWLAWPLTTPAILINVAGLWHILDNHRVMCEYRVRLKQIQENFKTRTSLIWGVEKNYERFHRYFLPYVLPFTALLYFGLAYVTWILLGHPDSVLEVFFYVLLIHLFWFLLFFWRHFTRLARFRIKQGIESKQQFVARRKQLFLPDKPIEKLRLYIKQWFWI